MTVSLAALWVKNGARSLFRGQFSFDRVPDGSDNGESVDEDCSNSSSSSSASDVTIDVISSAVPASSTVDGGFSA